MQHLNFPTYPFRIRQHHGQPEIFDVVRKRWVIITPEEWVRQHLIHFMNHEKKVPFSLMSVEKALKVNGMNRRTDLVVYNQLGQPRLICECKAPDIPLQQHVMDQAARYNITLQVPYLLITNGIQHICSGIDFLNGSYSFLPEIPDFQMLS